jgi:hypothetical protein
MKAAVMNKSQAAVYSSFITAAFILALSGLPVE